ncbi:hypothetical protein TWF730_011028 [Orbilia blumenaviensis]|uniref:Altered inheritance of mitochondria protein 21 n=1 Tax=Orbilia blumenaviensis TaxID=1796055 RepID=A0AAV9UMV6_9PEZI
MSSLPVVPPRPTRGSTSSPPENSGAAPPLVPARPARDRSKSPLPQLADSAPAASSQEGSSDRPSSPETKRKIDPNLDLHQPMAVRPAAEIPKAPQHEDIPEIGQRVPMLDFAGDVQAPSPMAPDSRSASRAKRRSQHTPNLPPGDGPMVVGDFGAYPAGKVYRQNGSYSLSHDDLTKSVMTASGAGVATTPGLEGVPDEEIGYIVSDEIASRDATPQGTPGGIITAGHKLPTKSPLATAVSALEGENDTTHQLPNLDEAGNDSHGIYGKGGPTNASSTSLGVPTSGRHTPWEEFQDERAEGTPILASDEAGKYPVWNPPAISPRLSAQEVRRPPSSNRSRTSPSMIPTEDLDEPPSPIKEHIPLFPEGTAPPPRAPSRPKLDKQASSSGFPSKDVWEDAPESSHATYEVEEEEQKPDPDYYDPAKNKITEKAAEAEASKDTPAGLPVVPTRPTKRVPTDGTSPDGSKAAPIVPERPKVPPRPLKKTSESTGATTDGSSSAEDSRSPPPPKPKPVIPGRVGGGIAALRANFMSDLNSRLSKGPVAPKKEEPAPEPEPKEREPLEDVRKTRARGPAKRKPSAAAGAAPAADTVAPATAHVPKLTFSSIITVYSIGDDYEVSFDETKFDDEPSKIARPIDDKVLEAVKTDEAEEKKEEEAPAETETKEEEPTSAVEAVKDVAQKVVDAVVPTSSTTEVEESKPESTIAATEEKTVVA